jgi:hypothetical protein
MNSQQKITSLTSPIFLVGTVKSATTITSKCLGEHPNVVYPRLAHFELSPEWCELAQIDISVPITKKSNCSPLNADDATDNICQKVHQGFTKIFLEEGGNKDSRFLNKSPHLWNKLPFVQKIFPDASLIITSRDIQNTVASTKRLFIDVEKTFAIKHYLPPEPKQCWSCIFPTSSPVKDPARTFPGGDVSVLAEYWLRVYKTIEETANNFPLIFPIQYRNFIKNPHSVLNEMYQAIKLPTVVHSLPQKIDKSRSDRWRDSLTEEEKKNLKAFIEEHYNDIKLLKYADTTISV